MRYFDRRGTKETRLRSFPLAQKLSHSKFSFLTGLDDIDKQDLGRVKVSLYSWEVEGPQSFFCDWFSKQLFAIAFFLILSLQVCRGKGFCRTFKSHMFVSQEKYKKLPQPSTYYGSIVRQRWAADFCKEEKTLRKRRRDLYNPLRLPSGITHHYLHNTLTWLHAHTWQLLLCCYGTWRMVMHLEMQF